MNDAPSAETPQTIDAALEQKTRRATRLTMVGQLAGQMVSLAVLAGLYRLVPPEEFGLLGMFMPFLLLLRSFGTLGMDIAAVQKRDLSPSQATTLFWYQVLTGVGLSVGLALLAPVLAVWYQAERLLGVGLALSATALLYNSFSQHRALAERKLHFGRLTVVRLLSLAISGSLALVAAWWGWGVWALVVQQYVELVVLNIGHFLAEPWRPRERAPWREVAPLVSFSGFYTLSGVCFAVGQNLDKIVLGVLLGHSELGRAWIGYYTQAYSQMIRPVYLLTAPISAAMLPALTQARDNLQALAQLTATFYRMVGILLAPTAVGVFVVGHRLMPVLGGREWIEAGHLLSILGLMILAQSWINISGSLLSAVGRADRLALGGLANLLVLAAACGVAVAVSGVNFGLPVALAWGISLATIAICLPYLAYCFRQAGVTWREIARPLWPAMAAAVAMGGVVALAGWSERLLPMPLVLIFQILLGVVSYVLLAWREVRWLWGQLSGDAHSS